MSNRTDAVTRRRLVDHARGARKRQVLEGDAAARNGGQTARRSGGSADKSRQAVQARLTAERVAREAYGRLVASLAARTGDVASAEDALAEAFASALEQWPDTGVPRNPIGWLLTVARRRQTDARRRLQTAEESEEHLKRMADEMQSAAVGRRDMPDRRLALMFACAHPDVEPRLRTPLILQTILGLNAAMIASAFLVPPTTMAQRLVRGKAKIRDAGIPFRVPDSDELPDRLDAVLEAVYAAYANGWVEADDTGASSLAEEAIWLGRVVVSLLPDEPEAKGMLALMLYSDARRAARRDARGTYVPLDEQDTTRWDLEQIDAAEELLSQANAGGPTGRYQIEAAIQSAHVARRLVGAQNHQDIVRLYDLLYILTPSPVVALNRAVARSHEVGAAAVLPEIERLATDRRMDDYQPFWAVRGHLLAEAGRRVEAWDALTVAVGLTVDPAVREYLQRRRRDLRTA